MDVYTLKLFTFVPFVPVAFTVVPVILQAFLMCVYVFQHACRAKDRDRAREEGHNKSKECTWSGDWLIPQSSLLGKNNLPVGFSACLTIGLLPKQLILSGVHVNSLKQRIVLPLRVCEEVQIF